MGVEEQHIGVCPEDFLGSVAVVGIPVDDQNALAAEFRMGMGGSTRDKRAENKCLRIFSFSTMTTAIIPPPPDIEQDQ